MIGYFVSDQQSDFYQSPTFTKVLHYVQKHPKLCKMKEKETRNGLRLLLSFNQINSVSKALKALGPLQQKENQLNIIKGLNMIIEPRTRGFICLTAHPNGCAQNVKDQISFVKEKGAINGPKKVLVIGASTGFGLASRITSAFGSDAATIGVFFEKPPKPGKTASAGWYNTAAFENEAAAAGLYAKSINGDAFSNEIKDQTLALIKEDLGQVDLVIYSLASPVRQHPVTGVKHKSVLKPIGDTYKNKNC